MQPSSCVSTAATLPTQATVSWMTSFTASSDSEAASDSEADWGGFKMKGPPVVMLCVESSSWQRQMTENVGGDLGVQEVAGILGEVEGGVVGGDGGEMLFGIITIMEALIMVVKGVLMSQFQIQPTPQLHRYQRWFLSHLRMCVNDSKPEQVIRFVWIHIQNQDLLFPS